MNESRLLFTLLFDDVKMQSQPVCDESKTYTRDEIILNATRECEDSWQLSVYTQM